MKRIGITGKNGFIGYHLYHTLKLFPDKFQLVEFKREFFNDESKLDQFVSNCDVIVHLAGMNRHENALFLFETNIALVQKLIDSLNRTLKKPHIIISSSTQEDNDSEYGKSKKISREILSKWAEQSGGRLTGMIIPNVFGPFSLPFYNSVVATFCYQISRNLTPRIDVDKKLNLIYVGDLVQKLIELILNEDNSHKYIVNHTTVANVSEILSLIEKYHTTYYINGEIPNLKSNFEFNLFNTYRSYIDFTSYFPKKYKQNIDNRGAFIEIIRNNIGGQTSYSTTLPEVTRGNHFHTRKIERFAVIKGKALIQLRKVGTDKVLNFYLDGDEPSFVDMPIWYTHNIKNIGKDILYTIFWINEPYNPDNPDTWSENV
ncbi:epimerase [Thermaurantimonas aggregans]|uniref:Epimerase n=1 Tax=Thermaurantimonas aggregans TaxID=2173829 RepID=A0A401XK27_9FLAO|nr:NAD-dependent epimerase/dehydratase family protein [Thermaurantimonas aggregans]MCX8148610.1 NAD-dependent epimerase/dehydratase family protein [Thermaurantimonas aggregans]GCD77321.1 epimerase [Thermaurantimonas aggregans]